MNFLVNLDVDDLDKAISFYSSVFALTVGRRFGSFGVEMLGGPTPIHLLLKASGTPAAATTSQRRSYERHWTPIHLDIIVPDIEAAVEKAVSAGAQLEKPVTVYEWGKHALMVDPFGHGFCFIEFQGRGYDAIAQ